MAHLVRLDPTCPACVRIAEWRERISLDLLATIDDPDCLKATRHERGCEVRHPHAFEPGARVLVNDDEPPDEDPPEALPTPPREFSSSVVIGSLNPPPKVYASEVLG